MVAIIFAGWFVAIAALLLLAWRAPTTWNRTLRVALMLMAGAVVVFLTGALFGVKLATATGLAVALVVYWGLRQR